MAFEFFRRKPDTFDYEESRICKCCHHAFKGRYCNICGEKVVEPNERTFLAFLDNLLNAFTFLDGKFLKSVKLLITRPGRLSRNIADGSRIPYMKMVSLFFVANFFYFLVPFFDSFNSSLYSQTTLMGEHSIRAKAIVDKELVKRQVTMEEFKEKYRAQSTNLSKLLLVILVLVMTVTHMALNYSKENYFFDHLLISLEFYSFHLLVNMLILPAIILLLVKAVATWGWDWNNLLQDSVFSIPVYGLILYFLIRAQLTFYKQKWYWAIPKAIILFYLFTETIQLYRKMLFYITVWTI
ncbi:MAG: DUF3667 domain-containing protein [Cyclobacteriaceae bacterium]|nr:DUF3667 domain-containing protein [Cyclobacteriaceae bacterium]